MSLKVNFIFRSKSKEFNSIEGVFETIINSFGTGIIANKLYLPKEGANLFSLISNLAYCKSLKGQINHITGHVNYISLILGKCTILTIHDIQSATSGNFLKKIVINFFWFKLPALLAKRITVISEFTKNELIQLLPEVESKVRVIHNPVNPRFQVKSSKPFDEGLPIILALGTKKNKNLERIVQAMEGISATLLIIGKLSIEQIQLLENSSVSYVNKYYLSWEEIFNVYETCDLLCFPSLYEGFGMPIIEAQAMGKPVITSDLGAMAEVAGNAAFLVNPYSYLEIRQAITKIIADGEFRAKLVTEGFKNVKRFDPKFIAQKYQELYLSLTS
ncbi:glycosyltransferase family 4 protein [Mongoliitalea lutea]|uniref:Uncharacterized protein n=1 Tax=Mongoliitalea lutea TaxID=849756 RepID=A0A8J3CYB9_9BACT|nr:glycosyltransferase family 1 protein [Mongoliitalea lutea]GHB37078.1 hypothetical protein GCM10008106_17950 [Mongoliitalea lutea]